MSRSKTDLVIEELSHKGILRTREIVSLGVSREHLRKMMDSGKVIRESRSLYTLPEHELSIHHSLAQAGKLVPQGVVCLLSALRFHDMTSQSPHEVWIAVDNRLWKPKVENPPLRIVRYSGKALIEGVEEHYVEGVPVLVYSPAKTVADCFKYRNKIGLEVALEALQEGWKNKRFSMDELYRYAGVCRVTRIMQPYIEMLTI
jgi:predicted transcriptional regulator of viral defense system